MLRVAQQARGVASGVFFGEERHLLRAYRRHARCARLLLGTEGMIDEADFHAHLAAECLLKHLFCLLRHSLGARADVHADFGQVKLARDFGHDVKDLSKILVTHDAELRVHEPMLELMARLPSTTDWNEDRYRERDPSPSRPGNIRRILELAETIERDVGGGNDDA